MRLLSFLLTLLLGVALVACHDTTGPTSDLTMARLRWAQHGPNSYQLTVSHSCFCTSEGLGPVTVTVANGVVQSRVYEQTGELVSDTYVGSFPSVDGLFAYIDHMLQTGTPVSATYDPELGYPVHITAGKDPAVDDGETTDAELSPLP